MSEHRATIRWHRDGDFARGRYSRAHVWEFDGGAVVCASASPANVPLPFADAAAVDPEEAFVAAVSSCHMLWFLDLARRAGLGVASYTDAATGHMEGAPHPWISRVELRPRIEWEGDAPDEATIADLHHTAHEHCFIANSIKAAVVIT